MKKVIMHPLSEDNIHLTDLSFFVYCEKEYSVNRGVYNTIDSMFYDRGIRHIITRRKALLSFLEFIHRANPYPSRIKFGHGGLAAKVNEYWLGRANDDEKETIY
jgi:riboflavin kinase